MQSCKTVPYESFCTRRLEYKKKNEWKKAENSLLQSVFKQYRFFLWRQIASFIISPLGLSWIAVLPRIAKSFTILYWTVLLLLCTIFSWFCSLHRASVHVSLSRLFQNHLACHFLEQGTFNKWEKHIHLLLLLAWLESLAPFCKARWKGDPF